MKKKSKQGSQKMKLISFLKPYWYFALLAPIFMVGEVLCDLMQPTLMSRIVDDGVLAGNLSLVVTTGIRMLCFAAMGGVAGIGSGGFSGAASQSFGNDLRQKVYGSVMSLSPEQTDKFTTGSLITRLTNDITMVQNLVEMSLRMFVRSPLTFIGGIIMSIRMYPKFALVLALSLPLQLAVLWLVLSKASPLFSLVQKKLDKVNSVVQENVSGARVVKAYVCESYEEERFDCANLELVETNFRVQKLIAWLNPCLMIIVNFAVIAIIYIGGKQVEAGALMVGRVMASVTYATQVMMSIMMVGMMFQSISRGRASAERIREVINTVPVISGGECTDEFEDGSIAIKNLSFTYPTGSGKEVLSNINLSIAGGQTIAVLGATGSGKTTLVSLLMRFYNPDSGTIVIGGKNIKDFSLDALRSQIGFVFQKSELFSGSVADNIRWGKPEASDEEVRDAAEIAQAADFVDAFNDGFETFVGEKGTSLSGGQKQRLCIARALIKKPKILIFDDSTSALDLSTEANLRLALNENLADTTVIMIAQRVASVMNADKIIVLENGEVAAFDTHENLMKSCKVYIDIYNSQNRQEVAANG